MSLSETFARLIPGRVKARLKNEFSRTGDLPSIEWSLQNMRRLGFNPREVVDVGAFSGEWTTMARSIFPEARFLMLEAQPSKQEILAQIRQQAPDRIDFHIGLIGPSPREDATFHVFEHAPTASSVLADQAGSNAKIIKCKMQTLDQVLQQKRFASPDLLKLDVQGYELEVLKGASHSLGTAQAVLMEVSLIDIYKDSPLMPDVIAFMSERGFQPYDICSLIRRALDQALWQTDMIFIRKGSALVENKTWD